MPRRGKVGEERWRSDMEFQESEGENAHGMGMTHGHEYDHQGSMPVGGVRGERTSKEKSSSHFRAPYRRNRRACTECRQAKLKCDAPAPDITCSRCSKLRLSCRIDAKYQRISRNKRIADLEGQVELLRSKVGQQQHGRTLQSTTPVAMIESANIGPPETASLSTPLTIEPWCNTPGVSVTSETQVVSQYQVRDCRSMTVLSGLDHAAVYHHALPDEPSLGDTALTSKSIDGIHLTSEQIYALFKIYFEYYHSLMPLLEPGLHPEQCYKNSPFLFWTIVAVASRRYVNDVALLDSLSEPVTSLGWKAISTRPHTRFTVEALVIQITWPFPVSTPATDNSYIYSGIALQAAIQLGLHRPEDLQDFSRTKVRLTDKEIQNRVKTWVCCNIAAQSTAMGLGYEHLMSFGWTITRCCEDRTIYGLSESLYHHLLIAKFGDRIRLCMSGNCSDRIGLPNLSERGVVMTMLERDLNELTLRIGSNISAVNQVYLCGIRVSLFSFHFFEAPGGERRRLGLLKAFAAACEFIEALLAADTSSGLLGVMPAFAYYYLAISSFLLLRIFDSSYAQYVDLILGKKLLNSAIIALRRASVVNNDLSGRTSQILSQLWRVLDKPNPRKTEEPSLRICSRFEASVLQDFAWLWREVFGGQENAYPTPAYGPEEENTIANNDFMAINWLWDSESALSENIIS